MNEEVIPPPAPSLDLPVPEPPRSAGRKAFREFLFLLRERLVYALPLALFIAMGFGYQQASRPSLYRATATLQIERPERVVTTQDVVDLHVGNEFEFNTYIQIISSDALRARVVASLTPADRKRLQVAAEEAPDLGSLTASAVRQTFLIKVSVAHRKPEAAALLANRFAEQFIEYLFDNAGDKNQFAVSYLRRRSSELLTEANAGEQRLHDYMRQHNVVSLDGSTNLVVSRLNAANTALQVTRLALLAQEEQIQQVRRYQREGRNLIELDSIGRFVGVAELHRQAEELRRERQILSDRYLRQHPRMIAVASALASCEEQLAGASKLAVAETEAALEKARATCAALEQELAAQEKEQLRLRDLSVEYRSLENQAQVAKGAYMQILDRLNQATTSKAIGKIPVRLLDAAAPPAQPFSPDLRGIVRGAAFIAVFAFVGTALFLAYFDDRLKSSHDVESVLGARLIGIVSGLGSLPEAKRCRLVIDHLHQSEVEAFNAVHAACRLNAAKGDPKILMLTSTIPGEGKTIVSSNLAATFAAHGKRVLLIDCDLRRPMLHKHFERPADVGLLAWAKAGAQLDQDITANPLLGIDSIAPNLWLLGSGGRTKQAGAFLESAGFRRLLEALKSDFDLIVIDTPPLGAVPDAMYIAQFADEFIYLSRFNRPQRRQVRMYLEALRATQAEFLGVIVNDMPRNRQADYSDYRYYRSYSKYYGKDA